MTGGSTTSIRGRRSVAAAVALVTVVAGILAAPAAHAQEPTVAVLHLEGRGFGHGVGLSQWGARYMADAGADAATILDRFYPGTALGGGGGGSVRVRVLDAADGRATLGFPQGGEVRSAMSGPQAPGFPVVVGPGGSVQVRHDGGQYHVEAVVGARSSASPAAPWQPAAAAPSGTAAQCIPLLAPCPPEGAPDSGGCLLGCVPTAPAPAPAPAAPPPAPPGGPAPAPAPGDPANPVPAPAPDAPPPPPAPIADTALWAVPDGGGTTSVPARGSAYRGAIQAVAGPNGLGLVNQLDVERYLAGMAEVPASWPPAVQQAQAIAARTYALRAMASGGELCDTQRCQVYVGAGGENANLRAAVDATRGQVLTHGGGLIEAVYSADAGGVSATPLEGFGTSDGAFPYLTTVAYDTPDPLPWVADIALRDVAARTAYPGTLTGVALGATGPSGRALEVVLDGDAGPRTVGGLAFAAALGLRSTLFTATILNGAAPPPPAGVDAFTQALPGAPAGPAGPGAAGLPTDPATVAAAGATGTGAAGRAVTLVAVAALLATVGLGVVTGRGSVVDPVLARPAPLTPEAIERRRRDASTVRRRAPRPAT